MRQKVNLLEAFSMSCGFIGFTFIFLNWMNFKLHLHIYTDNRPVLEKNCFTGKSGLLFGKVNINELI